MAQERLGLLVTTDKFLDQVIGIAKAAIDAGHPVSIFFMDEGVRLLKDPRLQDFQGADVSMAFCDHSCVKLGVERVENITAGSQYQNAVMSHESERELVF